jgi:hypothetical protein
MARDFGVPQKTAWSRVPVYRRVVWLELKCSRCHRRSYIPQRNRPLNRIGSLRAYAVCPSCGSHLVGGSVEFWPRPKVRFLRRLLFWKRKKFGGTTQLKDKPQ